MGQEIVNTFNKGMIQDFDKSVQPEGSYLEAYNFRLVTDKGGTSASLENINGNVTFLDFTIQGLGDAYYNGHAFIRDELFVFVTNNSTSTPSEDGQGDAILKFVIDTDAETVTKYILYDGGLMFCLGNKIKALGRYENEEVKKIYWVDDYNNIRYANVAGYLTTDGLIKSASNSYLTTDRFEFLSNVDLIAPELENIISGNIPVGKIQYAYQLYELHGSETTFSNLSGLYHLTITSDFGTDSGDYEGALPTENSGKGMVLSIDNTSGTYFNRCRIVAIHYSEYNANPTIRIAGELNIEQEGGVFTFVDIGTNLGEYTLEEFAVIGTTLFKAEDLESKNNILFAANIKEEYFDVSAFDTRTYRFDVIGRSEVYEEDGSYYQLYNSTGNTSGKQEPAVLGDWERFDLGYNFGTHTGGTSNVLTDSTKTWSTNELAGYVIRNLSDNINDTIVSNTSTTITGSGIITWDNGETYWIDGVNCSGNDWSIPETADCINKYNDLNNDTTAGLRYKFQSDGSTLGAEGLNFKISFVEEVFDIDTGNTNEIHTTATSTSYNNYASPWMSGEKRSWQVDEMYRVGVQFEDEKGRWSYVKWLNDLRMLNDIDVTTAFYHYNGGSKGTALYPSVEIINSFPTGVNSFRVVRSKREGNNRTILAHGIVGSITLESSVRVPTQMYGSIFPIFTDGLIRFLSPEVNFNRNIVLQVGDALEYNGYFTVLTDRTGGLGSANSYQRVKAQGIYSNRASIAVSDRSDIDDLSLVSVDEKIQYINSVPYRNYSGSEGAYGGTSLVIAPNNATWTAWAPAGFDWPVIKYRRNLYGSHYGGHSHEARKNSSYIPVSKKQDTINTNIVAYNGDTFISYFDYMSLVWDLTKAYYTDPGNDHDSLHEAVYFPVETSINLDLRHDPHDSMVQDINFYELMQEYNGLHEVTAGFDREYNQEGDLYQYNTVFSQEITTNVYYPTPFDFNSIESYDTRIKASNVKINGEALDSWTRFGVNEYIDVDARYGSINNLHVFKDQLLYFQDHAFGTVSVNQRALIQDNNPGALVLGTGDVLDRFDYMSTTVGNMHKFGMCNSSNSIYWLYDNEKTLYQFTGNETPLSKIKGMDSWFRNSFTEGDGIVSVYDNKYNEAIFTIVKTSPETIAYNEVLDSFSTFYSYPVQHYITLYNDRFLSVKTMETNAWLHDSLSVGRSNLYNVLENATIKFMVNDKYIYNKVFDNISYISTTVNSTGINIFDKTFTEFRAYNDYQNTDWITLTPDTNIVRKERVWKMTIPRDVVDKDVNTNSDIFNLINLDDTQLFKARMRDNYLIVDFTYDNDDGNYKFSCPFIKTNYRLSHR